MHTEPLATFRDEENNVSASVFAHASGFSVAVKDEDSGETVQTFTVYPNKDMAIAAARKIVA